MFAEEGLGLVHKGTPEWMGGFVAGGSKLGQQLLLLIREIDGHLNLDSDIEVALAAAAWRMDAFACNSKLFSVLRSRRYLESRGSVDGGHRDFTAQCGGGEGDGHFAV